MTASCWVQGGGAGRRRRWPSKPRGDLAHRDDWSEVYTPAEGEQGPRGPFLGRPLVSEGLGSFLMSGWRWKGQVFAPSLLVDAK